MKKFWDEKKARMSWNKTLKKNDFCALFRVLNRKTHDQRGFYFVEVVWGGHNLLVPIFSFFFLELTTSNGFIKIENQ